MNVLEHGILYGLPKIHKVNVPLCLIRSSIITHSFKIAKFLVPLLRSISSGIGVWLQILFLCSRITRLTSQNYNNMHTIKNVVRRLKWLINISVHAPEAYLHLVNLKIRHNTGVAKHWVCEQLLFNHNSRLCTVLMRYSHSNNFQWFCIHLL